MGIAKGLSEPGGIICLAGRFGGGHRHQERLTRLRGRTWSADPRGEARSGPARWPGGC